MKASNQRALKKRKNSLFRIVTEGKFQGNIKHHLKYRKKVREKKAYKFKKKAKKIMLLRTHKIKGRIKVSKMKLKNQS